MSADPFHTEAFLGPPYAAGLPAGVMGRTTQLDEAVVAPTISVVICAYTEQRWDDIVAAVESVRRQSVPAQQCILVIDHNPALAQRADAEITGCLVVESTGPRGLSGARNTGAGYATGDVVAFLDDDAAAAPDWLERLGAAYCSADIVAVGGRVAPEWQTRRPVWFPKEFLWVVGCSYEGLPTDTAEVRNLIGANMSFRRAVLTETGGFTTSLGRTGADAAGCEETELCIRAGTVWPGARVLYEPSAEVRHRVGTERATWSYFLRRCVGEGRSKSAVIRLTGARTGLASERSYLASTIPRGIARSAGEVVCLRRGGLGRLVALGAGVGATVMGFARAEAVRQRAGALALGAPALAFALWVLALTSPVPLTRMSDVGLLSVLPITYWAALALVVCSFCLLVRRARLHPVALGAHIVVLLLLFHATPAILYGTLRYPWAWKHVGIIDWMVAHHGVNLAVGDKLMVAYQDWPGFFTLNGMITSASGLASPLSYASWAPFVNELLYAGPLWLIFRELTPSARVRWSALFLFYIGNWVGQDYFSPQGFAYFLYLVALAVVFSRFLRPARQLHPLAPVGGAEDPEPTVLRGGTAASLTRREIAGGFLVILVSALAIAVSHQLTPYMLAAALVVLWIFRRLRYVSLAIAAVVFAVGWTFGGAHIFVERNLPALTSSFGHLFSNAVVAKFNATQASPDQLLVSDIDRVYTLALIVLGLVGIVRFWRQRRLKMVLPAALLVAMPGFALVANNYGGEVVFRVYLFALPFLAFFGATVFHSRQSAPSRRRTALLGVGYGVAMVALVLGFLYSYYGKERSNYFPKAEVSAVERLYRHAPAGSLIISASDNLPFPLERYPTFKYYTFTAAGRNAVQQIVRHPVAVLSRDLSGPGASYLVFAWSDQAAVHMTGAMPLGSYVRVENAVRASHAFKVIADNRYVLIVTR
jgi:GT2 family glycosyltransferase